MLPFLVSEAAIHRLIFSYNNKKILIATVTNSNKYEDKRYRGVRHVNFKQPCKPCLTSLFESQSHQATAATNRQQSVKCAEKAQKSLHRQVENCQKCLLHIILDIKP